MNRPEEEKQQEEIKQELDSQEPGMDSTEKKPDSTKAQNDPQTPEANASEPQDQSVEKIEDSKEEESKESSEEQTDSVSPEKKAEAPLSEKKKEPAKHTKVKENPKSKAAGTEKTENEVPEMMEKVISINRITKVTKGGKNLSFSALVVVGDTKGRVGYCLDKANEVATAIKKAITGAKKNMINVPLNGTTITHEIIGRCGGATVLLKPAVDGTGVIASGPVRAVCDGAGIHNILTKCHRSNNPINVVKATIDGLSRLKTKK